MAGGNFDSSLTRVQPTFLQLAKQSRDGIPWLGRLLRLGSRASELALPADDAWTGRLSTPVQESFEYPASPPRAYLETLLRLAPQRMPSDEAFERALKGLSRVSQQKRRLLRAGDSGVLAEALAALARDCSPGNWWVLEGTTMVDCALFAQNVTLFIEGKRTERRLTGGVSWDTKRHQVFRNLDALAAMSEDARGRQYYVLLVVDEVESVARATLKQAQDLDRAPQVAFASWPHRSPAEAAQLWSHYLGHTTWQRIAENFGGLVLPDDVATSRRM